MSLRARAAVGGRVWAVSGARPGDARIDTVLRIGQLHAVRGNAKQPGDEYDIGGPPQDAQQNALHTRYWPLARWGARKAAREAMSLLDGIDELKEYLHAIKAFRENYEPDEEDKDAHQKNQKNLDKLKKEIQRLESRIRFDNFTGLLWDEFKEARNAQHWAELEAEAKTHIRWTELFHHHRNCLRDLRRDCHKLLLDAKNAARKAETYLKAASTRFKTAKYLLQDGTVEQKFHNVVTRWTDTT
jgi:hypothetical protein